MVGARQCPARQDDYGGQLEKTGRNVTATRKTNTE
jgi:hypothetical protein